MIKNDIPSIDFFLMTTTSEAISSDRESHPDCSYSTRTSKSCRSINGKMECETVEKVLRFCPDSKGPCEIFSNILRDEPSIDGSGQSDPQLRELEDHMKNFDQLFGRGGLFGQFGLGGDPFIGGNRNRRGLPPSDSHREAAPAPPPHKFPKGAYPFRSDEGGRQWRGTKPSPKSGDIDEV
jgi:hypothetical protein